MSDQKRKTRLKGTESKKPCFDCGKTKDRFKDFKPRWAGCMQHRTERGRRFHKAGCAECEKIVNGNIRQPRCIECDKVRPKKQTEEVVTTPTTPTIEALAAVAVEEPQAEAPPLDLPEQVTEGKSEVAREVAEAAGDSVVEAPVVETPAPVVETPAPVVVTTPEPQVRPAPEAVAVNVPAPAPAPSAPALPTPRKKVATKADLFALFSGDDEPREEGKGPF